MSEQENSGFKKVFTFSRNSPGDSVPLQVTKKPFTAGTAPKIDQMAQERDGSGLKPAAQLPSAPQAPDISSLSNPVITLPQSGNTLNRAGAPALNPGAAPATSGSLPTIPGSPPKLPGTLPTIPGTPPASPGTSPTLPGEVSSGLRSSASSPQSGLPSQPGEANPAAGPSLKLPGVPLKAPTVSAPQSGIGLVSQITSAAPPTQQGSSPQTQQAGAPQTPPSISGTPLINVTSRSLDSLAAGTGVPKAYANAMREKVSYMLNFQVKVTSLTKHLRGLMRKTARQGDGDASASPPAGPGQ